MNRRLELHNLLVELFGNNHVYYQPPENLKMEYPCIRYTRSNVGTIKADNINYHKRNRYQIIVIDKKVDNAVIEKILELPMSSYESHYVSDNLNHDILTLYY
jgi:hypothetical protein